MMQLILQPIPQAFLKLLHFSGKLECCSLAISAQVFLEQVFFCALLISNIKVKTVVKGHKGTE